MLLTTRKLTWAALIIVTALFSIAIFVRFKVSCSCPFCLLSPLQYGRYIRAVTRHEKGLPMMTELLSHGSDRVVRAMSGALRNLAIDARNRDLLG